MTGLLRTAVAVSFWLLLAAAIALPTGSRAGADKDHKAALQECKKHAVAKERDECVSNANNQFERGKKEEKSTSGAEQGQTKDKTKDKAEDKVKTKDKAEDKVKGEGKKKKDKSAKVKPEDGD